MDTNTDCFITKYDNETLILIFKKIINGIILEEIKMHYPLTHFGLREAMARRNELLNKN